MFNRTRASLILSMILCVSASLANAASQNGPFNNTRNFYTAGQNVPIGPLATGSGTQSNCNKTCAAPSPKKSS